jgi:NhaP-type Na+/H+ or K+/H+ antiporter
MDLFLSTVIAALAVGFALGFGVRASISHYRRAKAERSRMVIH